MNGLRCWMDESSAPYEENEEAFVKTKENEEFYKKLRKEFNLKTKDEENE